MDNCIRRIEVRDRSLAPAAAEVWITVEPERLTPTTEVRGRLTGPRCAYANTVEVAYPLRPLPHAPEGVADVTMRVPIPEASLWEPESPFLYHGLVELWQDGRKCDQATVRHGLRQVTLRSEGLRINGRPLTLRGREVERCTEEEARALRRQGINLLVAPAQEDCVGLWEVGDRLGFLLLGRLADETSPAAIPLLSGHASCFGWLLGPGAVERSLPSVLRIAGNGFVGMEMASPAPEVVPQGIRFLAGSRDRVASGASTGLPFLEFEASGRR